MKMCLKILQWIIMFVNSCASIILLLVVCPRIIKHGNIDFDYMGIIVAVLALLVTFLVAWNIYSALGIEAQVKTQNSNIDRLNNEFSSKVISMETTFDERLEETKRVVQQINEQAGKRFIYSIATIKEELVLSVYSEVNRFDFIITNSISAVALWAEIQYFNKANNNIALLINNIPASFSVRRADKEKWISKLNKIPNKDKIDRFIELNLFIANLQETTQNDTESSD